MAGTAWGQKDTIWGQGQPGRVARACWHLWKYPGVLAGWHSPLLTSVFFSLNILVPFCSSQCRLKGLGDLGHLPKKGFLSVLQLWLQFASPRHLAHG